ncbi:MAG: dihydrofolate reductase [Saprospiraceae bacterium]
MQKIIVAAKSDNQVIGKENDLVWHLPADLRFFMSTIEGAYLATGRKSFESAQGEEVFGPHREFVIITRNKNYQSDIGKIVHSLEAAIQLAENDGAARLCILGGATIYEAAMDLADTMILTEVHAHFEGDTFFPTIDTTKWKEVSRIRHAKDAENDYAYSFVVYEKIKVLAKK